MNKKQPIKLIKFIDWGFMAQDTLLVIGYTKEKFLEKMKKVPKDWKMLINKIELNGFQSVTDSSTLNSIIYLYKFNVREWYYWDTLLHETRHVIDDFLLDDYKDESELLAYAHENLFRLCRKEIFANADKKRKKTKKKVKKKLSH
jgi:hypothetical protein